MNKDIAFNLIEENQDYKRELQELKHNLKDKSIVNIIALIVILLLSGSSVLGMVNVFKGYFSLSSIIIHEIINILPFAIGSYIVTRLVTSFVYGFNKNTKDRIKKLKIKIGKNNKILESLENSYNLVNTSPKEQEVSIDNVTLNYDTFLKVSPKVKKIGSIKR